MSGKPDGSAVWTLQDKILSTAGFWQSNINVFISVLTLKSNLQLEILHLISWSIIYLDKTLRGVEQSLFNIVVWLSI